MPQPVGCPRLAFGDVVAHRVLQRVETSTVGLCTGFHAKVMAPINIGVGEAFRHQLGLEVLEIVAGALDFLLKVIGHGDDGVIIERTAH